MANNILPKKRKFSNIAEHIAQLIKRTEREQYNGDEQNVWENITRRIEIEQKGEFKRRILHIASSAAAILLLAGISIAYICNKGSLNESFTTNLAGNLLIDMNSDTLSNILLVTANNTITLDNNANLIYNSSEQLDFFGKNTKTGYELNQIYVPKGKRANITFSDGSVMYINGGTTVIYPTIFAKNKRQIYVDGEVYMEVKRDEEQTFIVQTDKLNVRVLGTSFNVCSYKDDEETSVVLVEGKVEIETPEHEKHILIPNQRLSSGQDDKISIVNLDPALYTAWTQNYMILDREKLTNVLRKLSRHYGVNIQCDPDISVEPISGKLDLRDSIEDVLKILRVTTSLKIEKHDNSFYLTNQ